MKTFFVLLTLAGSLAQANYECTTYGDNPTQLSVHEHLITRQGDTMLTLESAGAKNNLFGKMKVDPGSILNEKIIHLWPFQGDQLKIVTQHNCGRCGCDPTCGSGYDITRAQLKVGEVETDFYCDETK